MLRNRTVSGAFFLAVLGVLVTVPLYMWVIMLLVGALWHEFGWWEPISFVQALPLAFVLIVIKSVFSGVRNG